MLLYNRKTYPDSKGHNMTFIPDNKWKNLDNYEYSYTAPPPHQHQPQAVTVKTIFSIPSLLGVYINTTHHTPASGDCLKSYTPRLNIRVGTL